MANISLLKKEIEEQLGSNLTPRQLWALANVEEGDKVAILRRVHGNNPLNEFQPYALGRISKATAKTLETGFHKYNREGMPANRYTQGYRLSVDSEIIAALQAEQDKKTA